MRSGKQWIRRLAGSEKVGKAPKSNGVRTKIMAGGVAPVEEMSSSEIYRRLWARIIEEWRMIVMGAAAGVLIGFILVEVVPPKYTVELRVVPAGGGLQVAPDTALGGFAGALSGLGIEIPHSNRMSDFILFPEVLTSTSVAEKVLKNRGIMKRLFPREYNARSKSFQEPSGIGSWVKSVFWNLFGQRGYIPPTVSRVQKYIKDNVSLEEANISSPVTTLSFSNKDKVFARKFLLYIYHLTDAQMRHWQAARAKENSRFLEKKLSSVSALDYREGLIRQLIPQEMTVMLSSANSEFVARILDGPTDPDRPSWPNPPVFILLGFFLGGISTIAYVTMRTFVFPAAENIHARQRGVSASSDWWVRVRAAFTFRTFR